MTSTIPESSEDLPGMLRAEAPVLPEPAQAPGPEHRGGLAATARSAVVWNTAFNLFRDFLQFATMLLLVRLLAPASYGEFGVTNSILGFLSVFGFALFVGHSLQVQNEDETLYQQHFTAGAVLNASLFAITNIVAAVLWRVPAYANVAPYVHVMSLTFLLEWPCELRRRMLERQLDWKRHRLLHASGLLAGSILAAVMALSGAGTWSLLIPGMLSTVPFTIDLFFVQRWRPTWEWSWASYRPSARFGVTRIVSSISWGGRTLLEASVLSVAFGFAGLGIYSRAVGLGQMFCGKIASQLMYAIYPVLTRVEKYGGNAIRTGDLILRFIAWTSIPTALVFATLAAPVVHLLYGAKWDAVIPLLPWTMAMAVLAALSSTMSNLLLARQQVFRCLMADIGYLIGTAAALAAAVRWGVISYIGVLIVVLGIQCVVLLRWLLIAGGASWSGAALAIFPPAVIGGTATLIVRMTRGWMFTSRPLIGIVLAAALFGLIYVAGIRFLFRSALEGIVNLLPARAAVSRVLLLPQGSALSESKA